MDKGCPKDSNENMGYLTNVTILGAECVPKENERCSEALLEYEALGIPPAIVLDDDCRGFADEIFAARLGGFSFRDKNHVAARRVMMAQCVLFEGEVDGCVRGCVIFPAAAAKLLHRSYGCCS